MAEMPTVHRAVVEHLVRQEVYRRLGKPLPRTAGGPSPLLVNVSARHCHLTPAAVEALFGKGHTLTPYKWLYQEGQYAAKESITLIGPRSRIISNLRILDLSSNFLTGEIPIEWDAMNNVAALLLQSNKLQGTVSSTMCRSAMHIRSDCNSIMQCSCCTECIM